MTAPVIETDSIELIMLDFSIPCTRADAHPDGGMHDGPSTATHYVTGFCAKCGDKYDMWPVCQAYVESLMSNHIYYWYHDLCGSMNELKKTVSIVSEI